MPKPTYQPSGVLRVRTIELILSVTVPKVWPGAMTGGGPCRRASSDPLRRRPRYSPSSGFTLRTAARYVVRGRVFSSPSSA